MIKLKSRYPGASNLPDEYGDVPHKKRKGRGQANAMDLYLQDTRQHTEINYYRSPGGQAKLISKYNMAAAGRNEAFANYQTAQAFDFDENAHALPALGSRNAGHASLVNANANILSSTKLVRETPLKQGKFGSPSPDAPQSSSGTHPRASRADRAKASPSASRSPHFASASDRKTSGDKIKKINKKQHFKKRDFSPQAVRMMMVKKLNNNVMPVVVYDRGEEGLTHPSARKEVSFSEKNADLDVGDVVEKA